MAKQTFTIGQVLTAAQMTSLQQTAMGGGSTTAKTASYTLVAADAGTVVQMNSASATTITVNTALFSAGDSVQIQNIGAGVCTVTAGTATVSTAGSLALSQYEGGQLYFNTTSAALFFDIVQAAGSGGMTLINSGGTTLTSTITTISSIPATYKDLVLIIRGFKPTTIDTTFMLQLNGTTSSSYFTLSTNTTSPTGQTFSGTEFRNATGMSNDSDCQYNLMRVSIPDYANTTTYKMIDSLEVNKYAYAGAAANWGQSRFMGTFSSASAISSIGITLNGVGWTSGTAYLYGVN